MDNLLARTEPNYSWMSWVGLKKIVKTEPNKFDWVGSKPAHEHP